MSRARPTPTDTLRNRTAGSLMISLPLGVGCFLVNWSIKPAAPAWQPRARGLARGFITIAPGALGSPTSLEGDPKKAPGAALRARGFAVTGGRAWCRDIMKTNPKAKPDVSGAKRTTMNRPPRLLVLSASVGAGHLRAAQAVELALRELAPAAVVKNIDVLELTNSAFRHLYGNAYLDLVNKAPHVLGYFYDMLDRPRRPNSTRDRL